MNGGTPVSPLAPIHLPFDFRDRAGVSRSMPPAEIEVGHCVLFGVFLMKKLAKCAMPIRKVNVSMGWLAKSARWPTDRHFSVEMRYPGSFS